MKHTCEHCGVAFEARAESKRFCCKGCEYVYELIQEEGLSQFYDLKRSASFPVKSIPYQVRDYAWLDKLGSEAESKAKGGVSELFLDLQGISCVGCVWLVEKVFSQLPGAVDIRINAHLGQLKIQWDPQTFDLCGFAQTLQQYGYLVGPLGAERDKALTQGLTLKVGICAAFSLNAMLFTLPRYLGMEDSFSLARIFDLLTALFATLSLILGGGYFIQRAWSGVKNRVLHIDLPIALGIVLAYLSSLLGWLFHVQQWVYFDFVTIFVFLMLVGRWLQEFAVSKNRNALLESSPLSQVVKVANGEKQHVDVDSLKPDDVIEVAPGQTVPVCSRLLGADGSLSLEWINGEPEPRTYKRGNDVPSGAMNIGVSLLVMQVKEKWSDSMLAGLVAKSAEDSRNPLLEKILRWYLGLVLLFALCGGLYWGLVQGDIRNAFQVMISVLVVSCPCALGVVLPLVNEMSVNKMQRVGLFIRSEHLWSRLSKVKKIIFDKTGTITLESPELVNVAALHSLNAEQRQVLGKLIENNWHPVCRSLREALPGVGAVREEKAGPSIEVHEAIGFGLWANYHGKVWSLGRVGWEANKPTTEGASEASAFDCELREDGQSIACFSFRESIKDDAALAVEKLKKFGLGIYLLSGDRQPKVNALSQTLSLPASNALGGLTPSDKSEWVAQNGASDGLMIGDGANDSLAFDAAACSGTPVIDRNLLEHKADFYFLGRGLSALTELFSTARLRMQTIQMIFAFAVLYNLVAVTLCLLGQMNPLLAAIIMPLSSLITLGIGLWHFHRRPIATSH